MSEVVIKGKTLNKSCLSFRLWIMDPEHINSVTLKNAYGKCKEMLGMIG